MDLTLYSGGPGGHDVIRLRDLLETGALREVRGRGVWVEDRPVPGPFVSRLRDAWEVLRGRADALTWPKDDEPRSWCAVNRMTGHHVADEERQHRGPVGNRRYDDPKPESPLGAAVRKVREGPSGAEVVQMIRAFNEGKFDAPLDAQPSPEGQESGNG